MINSNTPATTTTTDPASTPDPGASPTRWRPGQSGNPSGLAGRHVGLAALARDSTDDGKTLVAFYTAVLAGNKPAGWPKRYDVTPAHMFEAGRWLGDRGWGKAPITVDVSGEVGHLHALAEFTLTDLRALVAHGRTVDAEYLELPDAN